MQEQTYSPPATEVIAKEKALNFMLWIAMVSISMLFAGLTSGYIVRRDTGTWMKFDLPYTFWISTAFILVSSVTMNWGLKAIRKGNTVNLKRAVLSTLILGLGFAFFQFMSWKILVAHNIFFTGVASNASGSYLYTLTLLHLCHLAGGLLALVVVYINTRRNKYSAVRYSGIKLCAIYWHFLDGLWIYLFIFLLLIR